MLAVSAALPLITALLKRLQREFGSLCTSSDLPVNRRTHPLQPFAFCSRTLVERFALQTASAQEGIPCARLLAWFSFLRLHVVCADANAYSFFHDALRIFQPLSNSVQIDYVVPQVFYNGAYPTTPLATGAHGGFTVDVKVFLSSKSGASGTLMVAGAWGRAPAGATGERSTVARMPVKLAAGSEGVFTATLTASAADVDLWWPNGMEAYGRPALYNITASFTATPAAASLSAPAEAPPPPPPVLASRRIGFKHFALVTGNDTDPAFVKSAAHQEGTVNPASGLFWRINGVAVFSKGANMIPMDELEGRLDADAHRVLVESAAAAGLNTLRVWGGGQSDDRNPLSNR